MNKNDYSYSSCKWYVSSKINLNELFNFFMYLNCYCMF